MKERKKFRLEASPYQCMLDFHNKINLFCLQGYGTSIKVDIMVEDPIEDFILVGINSFAIMHETDKAKNAVNADSNDNECVMQARKEP